MKNSADQGGCYPQRPQTEVDNTLRDLQNSSILRKPKSIIALLFIQNFPVLEGVSPFRSLFFRSPK